MLLLFKNKLSNNYVKGFCKRNIQNKFGVYFSIQFNEVVLKETHSSPNTNVIPTLILTTLNVRSVLINITKFPKWLTKTSH